MTGWHIKDKCPICNKEVTDEDEDVILIHNKCVRKELDDPSNQEEEVMEWKEWAAEIANETKKR